MRILNEYVHTLCMMATYAGSVYQKSPKSSQLSSMSTSSYTRIFFYIMYILTIYTLDNGRDIKTSRLMHCVSRYLLALWHQCICRRRINFKKCLQIPCIILSGSIELRKITLGERTNEKYLDGFGNGSSLNSRCSCG